VPRPLPTAVCSVDTTGRGVARIRLSAQTERGRAPVQSPGARNQSLQKDETRSSGAGEDGHCSNGRERTGWSMRRWRPEQTRAEQQHCCTTDQTGRRTSVGRRLQRRAGVWARRWVSPGQTLADGQYPAANQSTRQYTAVPQAYGSPSRHAADPYLVNNASGRRGSRQFFVYRRAPIKHLVRSLRRRPDGE
jgi:hypothetical protein